VGASSIPCWPSGAMAWEEPLATGRQYVSWIHEADFIRAIYFLIEHDDRDGAVNLASPNPVTNRDFMTGLRRAWGASIGLPSAKWMLDLGAIFLRTETELILKSRRVFPGRLLREGFSFTYSDWPEAARDLCERRKAGLQRQVPANLPG